MQGIWWQSHSTYLKQNCFLDSGRKLFSYGAIINFFNTLLQLFRVALYRNQKSWKFQIITPLLECAALIDTSDRFGNFVISNKLIHNYNTSLSMPLWTGEGTYWLLSKLDSFIFLRFRYWRHRRSRNDYFCEEKPYYSKFKFKNYIFHFLFK